MTAPCGLRGVIGNCSPHSAATAQKKTGRFPTSRNLPSPREISLTASAASHSPVSKSRGQFSQLQQKLRLIRSHQT